MITLLTSSSKEEVVMKGKKKTVALSPQKIYSRDDYIVDALKDLRESIRDLKDGQKEIHAEIKEVHTELRKTRDEIRDEIRSQFEILDYLIVIIAAAFFVFAFK
jgi:uncharacterized coiled-coil DUF342 family protein